MVQISEAKLKANSRQMMGKGQKGNKPQVGALSFDYLPGIDKVAVLGQKAFNAIKSKANSAINSAIGQATGGGISGSQIATNLGTLKG